MFQQFLNHLHQQRLCSPADNVLLAVSGGIDSMVMFHLFLEAGYRPGIVHCNFGLREESDQEEAFVSDACRRSGLQFYSRKFDTATYARERTISVQVAARELRYAFFDEVLSKYGYHVLATAHHALDNLETVLINLTRGTGADGMAGIPVRNGHVIRPLLFASRAAIEEYALTHHVQWMDDASNFTTDYSRNLIRHRVLPVLKEINPGLDETIPSTLRRLKAARAFSRLTISGFFADAVTKTDNAISIDFTRLMKMEFPDVLLWEIIKDYGFSFDQCTQMIGPHQSGSRFISGSHGLLVDRKALIVHPLEKDERISLAINEPEGIHNAGEFRLTLKIVLRAQLDISSAKEVAQLDLDRLTFPLIWRTWKNGDHFSPIGMLGKKKKVSDFLVDQKIPVHRKPAVTVLESAGTIVWVVGMRISEHAKITASTERILVITQRPSDAGSVD